ncbi:putative lipid-transfer protein DIR1 [Cardamine amara subsp. amara]|uniref:Lipid-transfer protein DIR1 n=1 Tax=Cardamine amara subsp. amara TaxID=228776 RepID=A0ABD1ASA6_CARAN
MGKNNTRILTQFTALAMVLTVAIMVKEATSIHICNVDTNDLKKCRPAVTGDNPPPPEPACCEVAKAANLQCLCRHKAFIHRFMINPSKLRPLLNNCGVNSPSCF